MCKIKDFYTKIKCNAKDKKEVESIIGQDPFFIKAMFNNSVDNMIIFKGSHFLASLN